MKQIINKTDLRKGDYTYMDNPLISEEIYELMSKWICEWMFNKSNSQNIMSLE